MCSGTTAHLMDCFTYVQTQTSHIIRGKFSKEKKNEEHHCLSLQCRRSHHTQIVSIQFWQTNGNLLSFCFLYLFCAREKKKCSECKAYALNLSPVHSSRIIHIRQIHKSDDVFSVDIVKLYGCSRRANDKEKYQIRKMNSFAEHRGKNTQRSLNKKKKKKTKNIMMWHETAN